MLAPLGPHAEYGPCQPCGAAAALYRGGGTSPFLSLSSHLTISPIRGLRRSSSLCEHFAAAAMPHTPEVVPSDSSTIYSTQLRVLTLNVHGWHNEANLVPACASRLVSALANRLAPAAASFRALAQRSLYRPSLRSPKEQRPVSPPQQFHLDGSTTTCQCTRARQPPRPHRAPRRGASMRAARRPFQRKRAGCRAPRAWICLLYTSPSPRDS